MINKDLRFSALSGHSADAPVYTIGVAARMLGIPITIIREYESWGLTRPCVTETGRRLFSDVDIRNMREIRRLQREARLNLASIRFLAGCLPCWLLKPCSPEEREKCPVPSRAGVPCWDSKDSACSPSCEDCRTCGVYQMLASLRRFKELLWMISKDHSISVGELVSKED